MPYARRPPNLSLHPPRAGMRLSPAGQRRRSIDKNQTMSRSLIGTLLLVALTILFWLRRKEQEKKAACQAAQLESRGYVPISMDDAEADVVTKSASTAIRVSKGVSLAFVVFLIAAMAFAAVTEPLVKWILTGTLVAGGTIVAIWVIAKKR